MPVSPRRSTGEPAIVQDRVWITIAASGRVSTDGMNVLVLTNSVDAPFLAQQRSALEARGVEVSTLSVPGSVDETQSRSPLQYLQFFIDVFEEACPDYDLVHAHYGLTAPMALAQRGRPVVLSLWGSDLHGAVGRLSRLCARFCDEVIVMSTAMRRRLGLKCTVIPDGVDLELFGPQSRERARDAIGWDQRAHHVLFPYAPTRRVKDYPRARRIVGAAAERLETPVRLQTVYGVDHRDVPTYLNAADALLLTSNHEGSPNSVKEAMACNLPVVSTDVGDVRERLADVDPSVVSDDDALLVAGLAGILDRGERSNGRRAAHQISLDRTTDELLDVYERVTRS